MQNQCQVRSRPVYKFSRLCRPLLPIAVVIKHDAAVVVVDEDRCADKAVFDQHNEFCRFQIAVPKKTKHIAHSYVLTTIKSVEHSSKCKFK